MDPNRSRRAIPRGEDPVDEHTPLCSAAQSPPVIIPSGGHALHTNSAGTMSGSYRRPPAVPGNYGLPAILSTSPSVPGVCLTRAELDDIENDERTLLEDNKITTSYGALHHGSSFRTSSQASSSRKPLLLKRSNEDAGDESTGESTSLIDDTAEVAHQWEEAVMKGRIRTTWQREAKVLARYALPLMVTFSLQYSLTIASVLSAGNLGKTELAAVSLAGMTGSITGYAVFQGKDCRQSPSGIGVIDLKLLA